MTAKQYLSQAIFLRSMIRRSEEQLEEIRTRATSAGAIRYDKVNVQSSPSNDIMANYVAALERAEQTTLRLISDYYSTYATIQTQINAIKPELYSQVLAMRYLDGMKLERIADRLSYSDTYIRKVHGKALMEFSRTFLKEGTK